MKKNTGLALMLAAAGLIGCTNMTPQQQGTVSGAAIGAAAGAGIAAISGGSGWTGAERAESEHAPSLSTLRRHC